MAFIKFLTFVLVALVFIAYRVQSADFILGGGSEGTVFVYITNATRDPIEGIVQTQIVKFSAVGVNITYITAMEEGISQNATAELIDGGLFRRNCTLLITSAESRGYNYTIKVWGVPGLPDE